MAAVRKYHKRNSVPPSSSSSSSPSVNCEPTPALSFDRVRRFFKKENQVLSNDQHVDQLDENETVIRRNIKRNIHSLTKPVRIIKRNSQPKLTIQTHDDSGHVEMILKKSPRKFIKRIHRMVSEESEQADNEPNKLPTVKRFISHQRSAKLRSLNFKTSEKIQKELTIEKKYIDQIEKVKEQLSNIKSTPLSSPPKEVPALSTYGTLEKDCFMINSITRHDLFVEVLLKSNQDIPLLPNYLLWNRIRVILRDTYNLHMTSKKDFVSGEDVCVTSLLNWLIDLAPYFAMTNTKLVHVTQSLRHRNAPNSTQLSIEADPMSDFALSSDGIKRMDFEIARKLVGLFSNVFYLNCEQHQGETTLFGDYIQKDTLIARAINERMTTLFKTDKLNMVSLHFDPQLALEMKNFAKLLACFLISKENELRYFCKSRSEIQDLPPYAKHSLFKHLFEMVQDEKKAVEFFTQILSLKGKYILDLKNFQIAILEKQKSNFDEFNLSILYLILKASKKIKENSGNPKLDELKLTSEEFEVCREYLREGYNTMIESSDTKIKSWDCLFGIKIMNKLRKYLVGNDNVE